MLRIADAGTDEVNGTYIVNEEGVSYKKKDDTRTILLTAGGGEHWEILGNNESSFFTIS